MIRMVITEFHVTREEQKTITQLIGRAVNGADGSPPPPMDIEAHAIIRALFVRNPEAAYRVTMLAIGLTRELEAQRLQNAAELTRKPWISRFFKPASAPSPAHRQIAQPETRRPA
jgi:hypothetical protein